MSPEKNNQSLHLPELPQVDGSSDQAGHSPTPPPPLALWDPPLLAQLRGLRRNGILEFIH